MNDPGKKNSHTPLFDAATYSGREQHFGDANNVPLAH